MLGDGKDEGDCGRVVEIAIVEGMNDRALVLEGDQRLTV